MLYSKPTRLEDAVAALSRGAKALAGGTDLMLHLGREIPWPEAIVDLKALPELRELRRSERGLVIGAGLPLSELLAGGTLAKLSQIRSQLWRKSAVAIFVIAVMVNILVW